MEISKAEQSTFFSQPIRQIVTMLLAVALVGAGAWLIHGTVLGIIDTNPLLNGFIKLQRKIQGSPDLGWRQRYNAIGTEEWARLEPGKPSREAVEAAARVLDGAPNA